MEHHQIEEDMRFYPNASMQEIYQDLMEKSSIRITLIVVHIICTSCAIVGNAVVLFVIYKRKALRRNPTIIFIINLATIDLILCTCYRPLVLVKLILPFSGSHHVYYYSAAYCKTITYFQCIFAAVLYHTVVAISQERLLLIVYPLRAKECCSTSRVRKYVVIIWIVAVLCVLPAPIRYIKAIEVPIHGHIVRYCGNYAHTIDGYIYFTFVFLFYYIVPLIIVAISYVRIFFALYHRPENLKGVHEKRELNSLKARRSLAKMMLSIAIVFSLFWGPNFSYYFYVGVGGDVPENGFFIGAIFDLLPIIGSAINPFIYTINSRTFRRGFSDLVQRSSKRKSATDTTNNTFIGFNRQSSRNMNKETEYVDERKMSLIGNRIKGDVMM